MDIDYSHPCYDEFADDWQTVRDCVAGARKIKKENDRYLPRLHKQTDADYEIYKKRANFFDATKRTLQAMTGFIFRNNPEQQVPDDMAMFMKDATMTGRAFYDIEKETVAEVLSVGRRVTVIDWQLIPEDRAFLMTYNTEDVINWRYARVNGKTLLVLLVLREYSGEWMQMNPGDKPPDLYEERRYEQFRVYELITDEAGASYVQVTVMRRKNEKTPANSATPSSKAQWVVVDQQVPVRKAIPLHRIPAVAHGPDENSFEPREVPLAGIAELNISHYMKSADYENALHQAGSPTPIFAGFDMEQPDAYLGTSRGITAERSDAKAYFLSYNANDASALKEGMEQNKADMAALGARMLERQGGKGGQEAFETVQIRQSGDVSALMSATIACSQSLSDVLQWVQWWTDPAIADPEDLDEDVYTELNTEFIVKVMDAPMLGQLWAIYMGGGMTDEDFFHTMQRGGIVSSEATLEDWLAKRDQSSMNVPGNMAIPGNTPPPPVIVNAPPAVAGAAAKPVIPPSPPKA